MGWLTGLTRFFASGVTGSGVDKSSLSGSLLGRFLARGVAGSWIRQFWLEYVSEFVNKEDVFTLRLSLLVGPFLQLFVALGWVRSVVVSILEN